MKVGKKMTWRLGVRFFLPAEQSLEVFNPAEYENYRGPEGTDNEHAFENPYESRNDQTHKQTMLVEIGEVEQRGEQNLMRAGAPAGLPVWRRHYFPAIATLLC